VLLTVPTYVHNALLLLADFEVFVLIEDSVSAVLFSGLPDFPYCMGDPVFHPPSSTSQTELAAGEIKSSVFD